MYHVNRISNFGMRNECVIFQNKCNFDLCCFVYMCIYMIAALETHPYEGRLPTK